MHVVYTKTRLASWPPCQELFVELLHLFPAFLLKFLCPFRNRLNLKTAVELSLGATVALQYEAPIAANGRRP